MSDAPHLVTSAAVGDEVKDTALRLNRSPGYVQQMTEDPEKDRYSRFIQLYLSVSDAGAELYFQDFAARHKERMLRGKEMPEASITELSIEFVSVSAKVLSAFFKREGKVIVREGERLLQILGRMVSFGRKLQGGNNSQAFRESEHLS